MRLETEDWTLLLSLIPSKLFGKVSPMSRIGFILYRPRKGKEDELLRHIRFVFPMLRRNGFLTDRKAVGMKAKDGRILVVFEWMSDESFDKAGEHPEVQEYWMEADRISSFDKPADLPELHHI